MNASGLMVNTREFDFVDEDCFNFNLLKTTGAEGGGLVLLFLLFGVL